MLYTNLAAGQAELQHYYTPFFSVLSFTLKPEWAKRNHMALPHEQPALASLVSFNLCPPGNVHNHYLFWQNSRAQLGGVAGGRLGATKV